MKLTGVVWKPWFVNKLAIKHGVSTGETEQVLFGQSVYRFMKGGKVRGEDVYAAFGQTLEGRYLVVVFIKENRRRSASGVCAGDVAGGASIL